jgi:hypothetical protein
MQTEIKNSSNQVTTAVGANMRRIWRAMWRGQLIDKEFTTEHAARIYLSRCDEAGRIVG